MIKQKQDFNFICALLLINLKIAKFMVKVGWGDKKIIDLAIAFPIEFVNRLICFGILKFNLLFGLFCYSS